MSGSRTLLLVVKSVWIAFCVYRHREYMYLAESFKTATDMYIIC